MPEKTDFFVSYNNLDQPWAEWIAWQLEDAGYAARIQAWDFRPGCNFVLEMHRGLTSADRLLLVLSVNFLTSDFTQAEWSGALAEDASGVRRKLVPVRVAECKPEGLLRTLVYIDLVGKDEATARATLLAGVQEGRAKPTRAPRFPLSSAPMFPANDTLESAIPQGRAQFTLVLTGTIDEVDRALVEAIAEHLKKLSSDASMTLISMKKGSIRLVFDASPDGFERVKNLYEQGLLTELRGLAVEALFQRSITPKGHLAESRIKLSVDAMFARWYGGLERIARSILRRVGHGVDLDADVLVNEAYLRLHRLDLSDISPEAFAVVVARTMRHILVDSARGRLATQSGEQLHFVLEEPTVSPEQSVALIAVHEALEILAVDNKRAVEILELYYFAGWTTRDIAAHLKITENAVRAQQHRAVKVLKQILQSRPSE